MGKLLNDADYSINEMECNTCGGITLGIHVYEQETTRCTNCGELESDDDCSLPTSIHLKFQEQAFEEWEGREYERGERI